MAVRRACPSPVDWVLASHFTCLTLFCPKRISLWSSLARTALKFIPWKLSHTLIWNIYFSPESNSNLVNYGFVLVYVLIGLNLASLILTKKHQTIYDLIAKTYVVKQVR